MLYTVCRTWLLFQHIWADTNTSKEENFLSATNHEIMKNLNTCNYFHAISFLHNNPKVCIKQTSKWTNENISEKWVLIDAEQGRRGEFPRSGSAQSEISSLNYNISKKRKQKESKGQEVWTDGGQVKLFYSDMIRTPNEDNFTLLLELKT